MLPVNTTSATKALSKLQKHGLQPLVRTEAIRLWQGVGEACWGLSILSGDGNAVRLLCACSDAGVEGFCMLPMVQLPEPLLNHSMSVRKDGQIGKQRGCWQLLSWQIRLLQGMHKPPAFHTCSIDQLSSGQPADRPCQQYSRACSSCWMSGLMCATKVCVKWSKAAVSGLVTCCTSKTIMIVHGLVYHTKQD